MIASLRAGDPFPVVRRVGRSSRQRTRPTVSVPGGPRVLRTLRPTLRHTFVRRRQPLIAMESRLEVLIAEDEIRERIDRLAVEIAAACGDRPLTVVGILHGSIV